MLKIVLNLEEKRNKNMIDGYVFSSEKSVSMLKYIGHKEV